MKTTKKVPGTPWRKHTKTLASKLDAIGNGLLKLVEEAEKIKAAASTEYAKVDYAKRRDIEVKMGDIERVSDWLSVHAKRIGNAVTFKSDRERAERTLDEAQRVCRADYWQDVRGVADDFKESWESGEFSDREKAMEQLEQTIDGHGRVIYTSQAQECLLYSENDGAHAEEIGTEGMVEDGVIQWSRLAYFAFRADILARLDAEGINTNEEPPQKITDHKFKGVNEDSCEHPLDEADENGDATEATSELCGQPKKLHEE